MADMYTQYEDNEYITTIKNTLGLYGYRHNEARALAKQIETNLNNYANMMDALAKPVERTDQKFKEIVSARIRTRPSITRGTYYQHRGTLAGNQG